MDLSTLAFKVVGVACHEENNTGPGDSRRLNERVGGTTALKAVGVVMLSLSVVYEIRHPRCSVGT